MRTMDAKHYLLRIGIDRAKVPSFSDYPYCLPVCRNMGEMELHPGITFLVGENGAGKSTLLEAIAIASGFNAEGGSRNFGFSTRASHSCLHEVLTIRRGLVRPQDGFFLRAESFYNVATEISEYELNPYHLLAYHGNWYALALNTAKSRIETFALSRFRRIKVTGQCFTRPAEFNPERYARQAFGIVGGEELIKVRLLFEPKLAVYITERQWHPSQEFRMRPDGRVELRLETTGRKELVRWILSWMPDVKVLAPRSLRDRVAEKLRDGLRAQE